MKLCFFHYSPWKYYINLAGSELPLYSVDELSTRLGTNEIKIQTEVTLGERFQERHEFKWIYKW